MTLGPPNATRPSYRAASRLVSRRGGPGHGQVVGTLALALAACGGPRGPGEAGWRHECVHHRTPADWSACTSRREGSRNPDVVFWLHGGGGGARSFADAGLGEALRAAWHADGSDPPTVVAVSFGPYWFFGADAPAVDALDVFSRTIVPSVETAGRRFVAGESMGGFNAAALLAQAPDLFAGVALLCPAVVPVSPFDGPDSLAAYVRTTGADPQLAAGAQALVVEHFRRADAWAAVDPTRLAARLGPDSPALYVSCGRSDEFGFFAGAERLAADARAHGASVIWAPLDGGHCTVDPIGLARFLGVLTL